MKFYKMFFAIITLVFQDIVFLNTEAFGSAGVLSVISFLILVWLHQ